ncbi:hypothetical protein [Microbacterium sp.]|uniref:hypothetical protein n=1 Tax=Microbacterium sp. TaxID=51671 RepID=UPI003A910A96
MLLHARGPVILDSVSPSHPFFGCDLRELPDHILAEAAGLAILPELNRLAARVGVRSGVASEAPELVSSIQQRVDRIVFQYGRIVTLTDSPDLRVEARYELLESVTLAFVHMAGAFDALAIIHGIGSGLTQYQSMGWQKREFRKAIRPASPSVTALFDPGTDGSLYLNAMLAIRNTIHNFMPQATAASRWGEGSAYRAPTLLLEKQHHRTVFGALERAGWTDYSGIDLLGDTYLNLRPATLVLLLLNGGIPLLNSASTATVSDIPDQWSPSNEGFCPRQMQAYGAKYFGLHHLAKESAH